MHDCINAKDVCWIVNPAGIIFTLTARRKTFHFPCFPHTEIFMDTFVVGWSKESNSKERLQHLLSYNHKRLTCSNSSSEKLGTYIGDLYDRRKYLNTVN